MIFFPSNSNFSNSCKAKLALHTFWQKVKSEVSPGKEEMKSHHLSPGSQVLHLLLLTVFPLERSGGRVRASMWPSVLPNAWYGPSCLMDLQLLPLGQRCCRQPKSERKGNRNINSTSRLQLIFLALLLPWKHMHIDLECSCVPEEKTVSGKESLKSQLQLPLCGRLWSCWWVVVLLKTGVSTSVINEGFLDGQRALPRG